MTLFLKERGIDVLVIGVPSVTLTVSVPGFYKKLARELSVPCEGKILRKILSNSALKSDYIHPNKKEYLMMAERIAEVVRKNQ